MVFACSNVFIRVGTEVILLEVGDRLEANGVELPPAAPWKVRDNPKIPSPAPESVLEKSALQY